MKNAIVKTVTALILTTASSFAFAEAVCVDGSKTVKVNDFAPELVLSGFRGIKNETVVRCQIMGEASDSRVRRGYHFCSGDRTTVYYSAGEGGGRAQVVLTNKTGKVIFSGDCYRN